MSKKSNSTREILQWDGSRNKYVEFKARFTRELVANGVMDLVTGVIDLPVWGLGERKIVNNFFWAGAAELAPTAVENSDLYDAGDPPVLRTSQLVGRMGLQEWLTLTNYDARRSSFETREKDYKTLKTVFLNLVLEHLSVPAQNLVSEALEGGDPMVIWDQIEEKGKPTLANSLQDSIEDWSRYTWTRLVGNLSGVQADFNTMITSLVTFGPTQVPSKEAQIAKLTSVVMTAHAPIFKGAIAILKRGKDDKSAYDLERYWADLYLTEAHDASGDVWAYAKAHREQYVGKVAAAAGSVTAAIARSPDNDSEDEALLAAYAMVAADQARKSASGGRHQQTYKQAATIAEDAVHRGKSDQGAGPCNICGGSHIAKQCAAPNCVTCAVCKYKHRVGTLCPSPYHADRLKQQQKAAGGKAAVASDDGLLRQALKRIAALEKVVGEDEEA
jgi:hypothetical protein